MLVARLIATALLLASPAVAQTTNDPFPEPISAADGVIRVSYVEFASIPDVDGEAARMMLMTTEPGTRRLFVNDMRGPLYGVSYDGRTVKQYLDVNAATWKVGVQSMGNERGFQSFAFHPQFNQAGTRGFGKLYTLTDTTNTTPMPDFKPGGGTRTHDTVLLEWTAKNPSADSYDGGPPRELIRFEQPFANHNAGLLAFNPLAAASAPDFGLLYMSFADGGSGGDPLELAQNLNSPFGKLLRIDPLGSNSANGKYGIPAANPFVSDGNNQTLGEIYAYGLRNPQRYAWDSKTGNLFLADIGQNTVEEIDIVTAGANLGWNDWEGSFTYVGREGVGLAKQRADSKIVYPIVEYGQPDPLLQPQSAVTMGVVYRQTAIKQLSNMVVFGDNPSGEVFYISADNLPKGGQSAIRRVLFNDNGTAKTLLQLIQEKNGRQGKKPATRADLRFGSGPDGQILLLNKRDGTVRQLVPDTK
jgi:glucose/sorbosone dehydrogenase